MNLYDIHPDPENAPGYHTRYDTVPELVWKMYRYEPEKLKKRETVLAKEARYAYHYAHYALNGPFPAGEAAIATDDVWAYYYASRVLKLPHEEAKTWGER